PKNPQPQVLHLFTSAAAHQKRQLVGICVEECSLTLSDSTIMSALGIKQCPDGHVCKSNGCGHTCQLDTSVTTATAPTKCPLVLCEMFCLKGFLKGEDGCPVCKCA
ncbi:hypothetical protein EGW08_017978, partial [Elysia chlorotica]